MSDVDIFRDEFVPNSQTFNKLNYTTWKASNPGEATKWEAYRDSVIAGSPIAVPTLATKFGKLLVSGGKLVTAEIVVPDPDPDPDPVPTGAKLKHKPPPLVNPITVTKANISGSTLRLDSPDRDYIIDIDDLDVGVMGDIIIQGLKPGRAAHWIGSDVYASRFGDDNFLIFQDIGGTLFIEGMNIPPNMAMDAWVTRMTIGSTMDTSNAKIIAQNCRNYVTVPPGHTFQEQHPDCYQQQSGPNSGGGPTWRGNVYFDKCVLSSCMFCLMLGTGFNTGKLPEIEFSRTLAKYNVGADGTRFHGILYQAWRTSAIVKGEAWVQVGSGEPGHEVVENNVHPSAWSGRLAEHCRPGETPGEHKPVRRTDAISPYATWLDVSSNMSELKLREWKGNPVESEFCADGVPGKNYVSPGYL